MKTYLSSAGILLWLLASSCKDGVTSHTNASDTIAKRAVSLDTIRHAAQSEDKTEKKRILSHAQDSLLIESVIDSAFVPRYITVEIKDAGTLTGEIMTKDASANLRINRIIMRKATDGPFGRQFTYDITDPGQYILEITSSRMVDNPYSGGFTLVLKLIDSLDRH